MKKTILVYLVIFLASCSESLPQVCAGKAVYYDRNQVSMDRVKWIDEHSQGCNDVIFLDPLDALAADFVKTALRMGQVDGDYVDTYHGPKIWKDEANGVKVNLTDLAKDIENLRTRLTDLDVPETASIRKTQLGKLLRAMAVRLDAVSGKNVAFDKEVSDIYDVT